jgi:hypothetical protein
MSLSGICRVYGSGPISSQQKTRDESFISQVVGRRPLGLPATDWGILLLGLLFVAMLLILISGA